MNSIALFSVILSLFYTANAKPLEHPECAVLIPLMIETTETFIKELDDATKKPITDIGKQCIFYHMLTSLNDCETEMPKKELFPNVDEDVCQNIANGEIGESDESSSESDDSSRENNENTNGSNENSGQSEENNSENNEKSSDSSESASDTNESTSESNGNSNESHENENSISNNEIRSENNNEIDENISESKVEISNNDESNNIR